MQPQQAGAVSLALAHSIASRSRRLHSPSPAGRVVWHDWPAWAFGSGQSCGSATEQQPGQHAAPVVLLHGGSGSWTHWLRIIEPLTGTGRRVLAPDLPNFGDSDALAGRVDADDLPAVLEPGLLDLLAGEAFDLVGFSFGGMVAGLLAAGRSLPIRRLVLVGAPGMGLEPLRPVKLRGWKHLGTQQQRDAVHRANLLALMLHDPTEVTEGLLRLHEANAARDRMPARRLARTDALAQVVPRITMPLHAVYGQHDPFSAGQEDRLRAILAAAPGFTGLSVVAGAGHWVQMERPQAFMAVLAQALA